MSSSQQTLTTLDLSSYGLKKVASGKVREIFEIDDNTLLFVATDRISAYDVILENVCLDAPLSMRALYTRNLCCCEQARQTEGQMMICCQDIQSCSRHAAIALRWSISIWILTIYIGCPSKRRATHSALGSLV